MEGWTHAIKIFQEITKEKPRVQFFLLELDVEAKRLNLMEYTKEQEKELKNKKKGYRRL